jgi:hypothetical protein
MTVSYQAMRGLANVPWYWALSQYEVLHFTTNDAATTLTSSATAHTKGAWTQLLASTSAESSLLLARALAVSTLATETSMLLDLAVGASGSETPIAQNIAVGGASAGSNIGLGLAIPLPVYIPSGARLSARIQSLIPSDTCIIRFAVHRIGALQMLSSDVDVMGADTATSRGTALSGASGSWVQVTSSTSRRYRAVYVVPSAIGTDMANLGALIEVGFGAAGSEVSVSKQRVVYSASELVDNLPSILNVPLPCDIPAGSRLAVRHNIGANPDRYGVCVIGIP